jgi:signal transduction histidine kinase
MLLAIVPLSVVSYLAIYWVRNNVRESAVENVSRIASVGAAQLQSWLTARQYAVSAVAHDAVLRRAIESGRWHDACSRFLDDLPQYADIDLFLQADDRESVICQMNGATGGRSPLTLTAPVIGPSGNVLAKVTGSLRLDALDVSDLVVGQEYVEVFVADSRGEWHVSLIGSEAQLIDGGYVQDSTSDAQGAKGTGLYQDGSGASVVGAYHRLPDWDVIVWVQQPEEAISAREDDLAAMLIGSTLAVALLTAVLAAVVTRQITRPIVRLTLSAVRVAGGDLEQSVRLDQRDEIGVLARAFNIMTAELRSLYADLENKVAQRTRQLTDANKELRHKAMQLRLGADVGRVATSILDLEMLLRRVTELILDTYERVYDVQYVAVWLVDGFEEGLERRALCGRWSGNERRYTAMGSEGLIGETARTGQLGSVQLDTGPLQIAVPLGISDRVIGVLELLCRRSSIPKPDEAEVLQSLGNQISVAIENARLYAIEHEAVERLSRLDDLRLASLGVGSRELATELNTIIGFSRLMLKGADGPLTDLQQADLRAIHKSGYKLMGLIDNVITLSELESGEVGIDRESIDLAMLLQEVRAKAEQRLNGATIEWGDLDINRSMTGDRALLQQALLGLLTAATEQVLEGTITVTARMAQHDSRHVELGIGAELSQACQGPESLETVGSLEDDLEEMNVELALAHRIITLHGGHLRFVFDPDGGWNSITILPTLQGQSEL